ncbi:MAG: AI-2E family transporter [Verrucomicrobiota bacterium]
MKISSPSETQSRLIWIAVTGLAVATVIGLVVALVWGLGRVLDLLSPVLWPLAIAAVVACLLAPVVGFFEKHKVSRLRAIILVFCLALALAIAVLASIVPRVVIETQELAAKVPEYSQRLQSYLQTFLAQPPAFLSHFLPPSDPAAKNSPAENPELASATKWLTGSLPEMGSWLLKQSLKVLSGFGLLAGLALIPVYAFYFLLEQRRIELHWKEYLPCQNTTVRNEAAFVLEAINQYLVAFFRGQVLVAICDAILYTIGFLIVGVNYAFLLGFAAVLLTMIPFIGSMMICLTALTLSFVQYGDWQHPALVLAVFALVQTVEGLAISPKIMGDRVGLHPLAIIVAVMTGTTLLGGILGGVLAIPLAAALRVILARYLWPQRDPE